MVIIPEERHLVLNAYGGDPQIVLRNRLIFLFETQAGFRINVCGGLSDL
jgi:hypothetical protein